MSSASPWVPAHAVEAPNLALASGLTGGDPAKRGGISTSALDIRTATGLRSPPIGGQTEPLRLQRNSPASTEWIQHPDLLSLSLSLSLSLMSDLSISCLASSKVEGSFVFSHTTSRSMIRNSRFRSKLLVLLGGEPVRMGGRVVHQRSPQHCPRRRQRPPAPATDEESKGAHAGWTSPALRRR